MIACALPARAQQSELQRCEALPRGASPALVEYCQGVIANSPGNPARSTAEAVRHYQKAAQMGVAEAQAVMGWVYEHGFDTISPDIGQAVQWYEKAAAQGNAGAELNLGELYAKGNGVPRDPAKARQLIQAAANQGLAPARRALAELDTGGAAAPGADTWKQAVARYQSGDHAGAARLTLQAAQAGYPTAIYEMGYMYENGDGVPKNLNEAQRWYRTGAEKGEAQSERALGLFSEMGWGGIPDDWVEAAKWYTKSAAQGDRLGEFYLGRAYQFGIGVPLNLPTATAWYDKAAGQGDSQAAYFAKYLRDNHGFDGSAYSNEEQAIMAPYMAEPWHLQPPPTGRVFRNTEERLNYFRAWAQAAAAFLACVQRHRGAIQYTCPAPVPPR